MSKVLFVLLVSAMAVGAYLIARFIAIVKRSKLLSYREIEDLSRLLISGDGNTKEEWRALMYVLERKYANLGDEAAVVAGDQARTWWFITLALMCCFTLSWQISGW